MQKSISIPCSDLLKAPHVLTEQVANSQFFIAGRLIKTAFCAWTHRWNIHWIVARFPNFRQLKSLNKSQQDSELAGCYSLFRCINVLMTKEIPDFSESKCWWVSWVLFQTKLLSDELYFLFLKQKNSNYSFCEAQFFIIPQWCRNISYFWFPDPGKFGFYNIENFEFFFLSKRD